MTDLGGEAILALWNGVDPARRCEYDLWHTREHVPERIGVPGMRGARRYERVDGPLPQFLTVYDLDTLGVLTSPAYRRLLDGPTEWSRSMRPSLRTFMRLCCRRLASAGGGLGGWLLAMPVDERADLDSTAARDWLARLLTEPAIVAAHLLRADPSVPEVPFATAGKAPDFPRAGAILLESFSQAALTEAQPRIGKPLAEIGARAAVADATVYRLAYAIGRESLTRLVGARRQ